MAEIGKDLNRAVEILKNNELIGFPTETVYGLAGNAINEKAILSIFKTKNRPTFDPLIVHTHSSKEIDKIATKIPPKINALLFEFSPGPLTVLLPKKAIIPDLVTSGLPNVAIRIPKHSLALELLSLLDFPLAAPSANPFGYVSPTRPQHVNNQLGSLINYILDGGDCSIGLESTIVGEENGNIIIYRLGGLKIEEIEEVVGKVKINAFSTSNPKAPGMLESHYSPTKRIQLLNEDSLLSKNNIATIGYIGFDKYNSNIPIENQLLLSENGSIEEAAQNLFSILRETENLAPSLFYTNFLPNIGLGRAINDRLKRAMS